MSLKNLPHVEPLGSPGLPVDAKIYIILETGRAENRATMMTHPYILLREQRNRTS